MIDKENVSVLNYNMFSVSFESNTRQYYCKASKDGQNPTVISMTLSELKNVASTNEVFNDGFLFFEKDVAEEIYKELHITNWKDIITNKEIEEILLSPTAEGLQRLIDIESSSCFERVRNCLFKLSKDGAGIDTNVTNLVNRRFDELQRRQRKSDIIAKKKDFSAGVDNKELDAIKAQNAALQEQMKQMQEMMTQFMALQKPEPPVEKKPSPAKATSATPAPKKTIRTTKTAK